MKRLMKILIMLLTILLFGVFSCCNDPVLSMNNEPRVISDPEFNEQSDIFTAEWLSKGNMIKIKAWHTDPIYYFVQFAICFIAKMDCGFKNNEHLAAVQEVMFVENPIESNEKGVWYVDTCSNAEDVIEYNLDKSLDGVLTGIYHHWNLETGGIYSVNDCPRLVGSRAEELNVPKNAHWKFKMYLVCFDPKLAKAAGRWRDGITRVIGVIDWEIWAALIIDPVTGEPRFLSSASPDKPVMRAAKPNEIQWRPMPSTRNAWHRLVDEIKRGPIINGETNIWHSSYGHIYGMYPRPFWLEFDEGT